MKRFLLKRSKQILCSHATRRIDGGMFYESFVRLLHCVPLLLTLRGSLSLLCQCPSNCNASWYLGTEKMVTIPISKVERVFEPFSSCLLITFHNQQECSSHVHRKDLSSALFGPMKAAARCLRPENWHEWPYRVSPDWFRCKNMSPLLGRRHLRSNNGNDARLMEGYLHRNLE